MHISSAARRTTVLLLGLALCWGCKKQEEQKTEAPQTPPAQTAPAQTATTPAEQGKSGEALFKERCAACHPDGGNTMKPDRTLQSKSLASHNITKPEDVVKVMRNPGQGMPKFDEATLPDQDAKAIANYVLDTFK